MVGDSEREQCRPGSMMFQGKMRQVTSVIGKRLLTKSRQRSAGCLYEFKVQLDGCELKNLAEWVDQDDLKDGMDIIKKFGTTTTTTICARYIM